MMTGILILGGLAVALVGVVFLGAYLTSKAMQDWDGRP